MKTISSKQLRSQLEETFDDVLSGQDVIVTYRSKKPIRITSSMPTSIDKKNLNGLAAFDAAPKNKHTYANNLSVKELYKKSLEQKYGQK